MSSSSPTGSSTSYSSPYKRRFERRTRREALQRLTKSSPSRHSRRLEAATATALQKEEEEESSHEPTSTTESLVQQQARAFGGTIASQQQQQQPNPSTTKAEDYVVRGRTQSEEDERKSSDGGTTVTTASSTTHTAAPSNGYTALADDGSDQTPRRILVDNSSDDDEGEASSPVLRRKQPQHLETHEEEEVNNVKYYRIKYPGVVALLSNPDRQAPKSGAYVSYGEVVASRYEVQVEEEDESVTGDSSSVATPPMYNRSLHPQPLQGDSYIHSPESPPRSVLSQHGAGSVSSLDTLKTSSSLGLALPLWKPRTSHFKTFVRVDEVLTGGYAVDATDLPVALTTPKRSNTHYQPMVASSPLPLNDSSDLPTEHIGALSHGEEPSSLYGFLCTERKSGVIAARLGTPPTLETGTFLCSIVSSTPLPILTGPCLDAPRTKAMLLPGTSHEVCLKLKLADSDVIFLRLSHRRGWITDRRVSSAGGVIKVGSLPAVVEGTDPAATTATSFADPDDSTISALSVASTTSTQGSSRARRRHRPPRRKRETKSNKDAVPYNPAATTPARGKPSLMETPRKNAPSPLAGDKIHNTPSSNVSLMSEEEESFAGSSKYQIPSSLTPDRSETQQTRRQEPNLFLMRVNAPRGLQILDAPHFQVTNLIHGKQDSKVGSPMTRTAGDRSVGSVSSKGGSTSIFQTMVVSHTTPRASNPAVGASSPAVFDVAKKARNLPRGVWFEASKRMEASGAFSVGAGLIKLSDNSGWAIVPTREELDTQYRNYRGGVASIREGEATKAYEEVGNAIVDTDDHSVNARSNRSESTRWLRIVAKNGVDAACPPPAMPIENDEDSSPTSSTAGSSVVSGGGSYYGLLSSRDSDVASSVGSAFLDSMFRTPKKSDRSDNDSSREANAPRKKRSGVRNESKPTPTLLPCGTCVEVDRWSISKEARSGAQDFVRLYRGQGWIPLKLHDKVAAVGISQPEVRLGSFWFRVMSQRGIKVRVGPSRKSGSIKSDDGVYFRFECGEFLRASEIVTIRRDDNRSESFAKLYRNRHVQLNRSDTEFRSLASLTTPAEWVQIHTFDRDGDDRVYLDECEADPRIQRHKEGWRYNVIAEGGVPVRMGPSFAAETSGLVLLAGESVLVNERVTAPGERLTWLRVKNGKGWVHDLGFDGEPVMLAHSLRDRAGALARPQKAPRSESEEVAYNSIIARLFHANDNSAGPSGLPKSYVKK